MTSTLLCIRFEVFGKVQGVFFRRSTLEQATALGLSGWCMNTVEGTVKGVLEGDADKIELMKHWLQYKGSPHSKIDKVTFTNQEEIESRSFDRFFIKH